jgi:hypothetical protein
MNETDIVELLRKADGGYEYWELNNPEYKRLTSEAADEIERLRTINTQLLVALKIARHWVPLLLTALRDIRHEALAGQGSATDCLFKIITLAGDAIAKAESK